MLLSRMIIEMKTPLHCGGGQERYLDQPVVRDAFGNFYIPGSSIAGILRNVAEQYNPVLAEKTFGSLNVDTASFIECLDAYALDFDGHTCISKAIRGEDSLLPSGPYLRDHVKITNEGVAKNGGKFDEEIVPAGTRFTLQINLNFAWGNPDDDVRNVFMFLLAQLQGGHIQFGAKRRNGYGTFSVLETTCSEIDLSSPEGMEEYLNLKNEVLIPKGVGTPVTVSKGDMLPRRDGLSGHVALPMCSNGPLLIGGGDTDEADIVCYQTPVIDYWAKKLKRRYAIPSTSIKGVIRHSVERIATALYSTDEAEEIADALFGNVKGSNTCVGKVTFFDAMLPAIKETKIVQHVAVDRFTGGALEGALYNEAPVWEPELHFTVRVQFDALSEQEGMLLSHAMMDLCSGRVSLGSGANRGNGFVHLEGLEQDNWLDVLARLKSYKIVAGDVVLTPNDTSGAVALLDLLENAPKEQEVA